MAMQCEVYLKNGIRLVSSEDLVKTVYNNPDIERIVLMQGKNRFVLNLKPDMRLIFFRDIKCSSPPQITYNLGFQKTVRGRNVKAILRILPTGEFELCDG